MNKSKFVVLKLYIDFNDIWTFFPTCKFLLQLPKFSPFANITKHNDAYSLPTEL